MSLEQQAALWWRMLYSELESSAVMRTPGIAGKRAARRVGSVRELFFSLAAELPITSLIEIGAKDAETSRRFVESKPSGSAVAYEAAPSTYQKTLACGLPERMELVNVAIGAKSGNIPFFLPLDERASAWGSTRKRRMQEVPVTELTVPMITLEEAGRRASSGRLGRDTALWLDVEGATMEVLSSGTEFIKGRVGCIYMEVYDVDVYEGSGDVLQIIQLMLDSGFIPVARDNQFELAWNLLVVHQDAYYAAQKTISTWLYKERRSAVESGPPV